MITSSSFTINRRCSLGKELREGGKDDNAGIVDVREDEGSVWDFCRPCIGGREGKEGGENRAEDSEVTELVEVGGADGTAAEEVTAAIFI